MSRMTISEQLRLANEDAARLQQELRKAEDLLKDGQRQIDLLERAQRDHLAAVNAEWQKKFDSEKAMKEHYSRSASKAEEELEQIHIILDAVEGAPSREVEETNNRRGMTRAVGTRVAGAFLAIASRASVKSSI